MRLVVLLTIVAGASLAKPLDSKQAVILVQESELNEDGSYRYRYEADDGTSAVQEGRVKEIDRNTTATEVKGSFDFKADDGNSYRVQYVADEFGYRPEGDHIPKTPPAIQRAVDYLRSLPPQQP